MNIYIHDHTANVYGLAQLPGLKELQSISNADLKVWPDEIPKESVVFLHAGNDAGRTPLAWQKIASKETNIFIIFVSSNPVGLLGSGEAWFCCRRNFKEVVDSGDVPRIVAALESGANPSPFLEYTDSSAKFAFRLLCEAWLISGGEAIKEFPNITIHAPVTLRDWLAPFGKSSEHDIPNVAAMVGAEAEVAAVLNAAKRGGNLAAAIKAYLTANAGI